MRAAYKGRLLSSGDSLPLFFTEDGFQLSASGISSGKGDNATQDFFSELYFLVYSYRSGDARSCSRYTTSDTRPCVLGGSGSSLPMATHFAVIADLICSSDL